MYITMYFYIISLSLVHIRYMRIGINMTENKRTCHIIIYSYYLCVPVEGFGLVITYNLRSAPPK